MLRQGVHTQMVQYANNIICIFTSIKVEMREKNETCENRRKKGVYLQNYLYRIFLLIEFQSKTWLQINA